MVHSRSTETAILTDALNPGSVIYKVLFQELLKIMNYLFIGIRVNSFFQSDISKPFGLGIFIMTAVMSMQIFMLAESVHKY